MIDANKDKECERNKIMMDKLKKTCGYLLDDIANMRTVDEVRKENMRERNE